MNRADLLHALARVAEGAPSPEAALRAWARETTGPVSSRIAEVGRRLAMGLSLEHSLEPLRSVYGPVAYDLLSSAELARDVGCRFAPMVRGLAEGMERRAARQAAGAAAAGAARASARMMAGLPAFLFPLGLLGGAPLLDALGVGTMLLACALGIAGWRWVERLIPDPPTDDAAIAFATRTAAVLEAGVGLERACDVAGRGPAFGSARYRTREGMSWPDSLAADDNHGVAAVGRMLQRCAHWGTPAARELVVFAEARRAEMDRRFEIALRAAPVRMVAPLVTCALPSFCLVTVVPLLREVGGAT